MHPVACKTAWGSCRTIIALSNVIPQGRALDSKEGYLHVGNRASREQVNVHNIPIDRVPHVGGERAPEAAHEVIDLNERRSRPWVQHIRVRCPRRHTGGRSVIQVFCKVPSAVSEVEVFHLGEDDRSFDHQNERVGLALRVGKQDMWIVKPLSFLGENEHLSSVGVSVFLEAKTWPSSHPLFKLVPSQREKLSDIHVIFSFPVSVAEK